MRSLLLSVLLSVITASQIRAETERELFSRMVDASPKASPGEFKTPDSVARCFVQGIIDNHIQDTFRCIPLSRMFASDTFENRVRFVGNHYSAINHDLLPDDDYGRYLRLLRDLHYAPVQKCRIALLLASDPARTNLLEKPQQPGDKDPVAVNKWIEKLAKDLSFQNITNAAISSVKSEPRKNELKHLGVLPFKDIHKVTVHVSVRGSDAPIIFLVGSIDGNYQIVTLIN